MRKPVALAIGLVFALIPQLASAQAALVMVTYVSEGGGTLSPMPAQSIIHTYIDLTGCQKAAHRASLEATIPDNKRAPSIMMSFVCVPTDKGR